MNNSSSIKITIWGATFFLAGIIILTSTLPLDNIAIILMLLGIIMGIIGFKMVQS